MAKKSPEMVASVNIIEGVVRHKPCGWVSDGGAFVAGAGCPKCGKPITRADVTRADVDAKDEAEEDAEEEE